MWITTAECPRRVMLLPPGVEVPEEDRGRVVARHGQGPPVGRDFQIARRSHGNPPGSDRGFLVPDPTRRRPVRPRRWRDDGHPARGRRPSRDRGTRGLVRASRPSSACHNVARPDSSVVARVRPSGPNASLMIGNREGPVTRRAGPLAGSHRWIGSQARTIASASSSPIRLRFQAADRVCPARPLLGSAPEGPEAAPSPATSSRMLRLLAAR